MKKTIPIALLALFAVACASMEKSDDKMMDQGMEMKQDGVKRDAMGMNDPMEKSSMDEKEMKNTEMKSDKMMSDSTM